VEALSVFADAAGDPAPDFSPLLQNSNDCRPRWRRFTVEYMRAIIDQANVARDRGEMGFLLRRKGLYSLHLATWGQQRKQGELDALRTPEEWPQGGCQSTG